MTEAILRSFETTNNKLLTVTSTRIIVSKLKLSDVSRGFFNVISALLSGIWFSGKDEKRAKIQELLDLTPQGRLIDNKANYAINYEEINAVGFFTQRGGWKIRITTGTREDEFALSDDVSKSELERLSDRLSPMLTGTVTVL